MTIIIIDVPDLRCDQKIVRSAGRELTSGAVRHGRGSPFRAAAAVGRAI
jgi:hypothetical protein